MDVPNDVRSIEFFRTNEFRVFEAKPYFGIHLIDEISWHKKHIKMLKKQEKNPKKFAHDYHTNPDKVRHHKEWVIDSIPFHEKVMNDHIKKLETILNFIAKRKYKKIVNVSLQLGTVPEYFVYHKKSRELFFVSEHGNQQRGRWVYLIRDYHKYCDVIVLNVE